MLQIQIQIQIISEQFLSAWPTNGYCKLDSAGWTILHLSGELEDARDLAEVGPSDHRDLLTSYLLLEKRAINNSRGPKCIPDQRAPAGRRRKAVLQQSPEDKQVSRASLDNSFKSRT